MRLLTDLHIAPRTVAFLRNQGHDVVEVAAVLCPTASDHEIVDFAIGDRRVVLTQDLDFSSIVALSGRSDPSIVTLRLNNATVSTVNDVLAAFLPGFEASLESGALVTIDERRARSRRLPLQ